MQPLLWQGLLRVYDELVKRTEIKRGKPLARGKPMARGSGLKKSGQAARSGGLARRSPARTREMSQSRVPLVRALVEAGVTCEIAMVLEDLGINHQCQRTISGMHERRKSGAGGSRLNRDNLIPACSWCNGFIEDATGKDRDLIEDSFLVVRDRHPDWDRLSKRHDREL